MLDVVAHHAQVGADLAEIEQDGPAEHEAEDDAGEGADGETTRTLVRLSLQTCA